MGKMNLTLAGTTFTDYLLTNVGSGAFRLEHDYFTKQDLVIRTAPSGGGTLLVEDTDYTLGSEDTYLSAQVTAAVGSGRNVFLTVTIINASYQTGNLYFSGKYVADAVEAGDVDRIGYSAKSANFTVRRDDGIRTFNVTTGSGSDITAALPTCDGTNGRIRFVKVDTGTAKLIVDGYGTEKIGVEGNALTFDLYAQGDWVEIEDMGTYWSVVGTNGPEIRSVLSPFSQAGPATGTWYNAGSIALPAGRFEVLWSGPLGFYVNAGMGTVCGTLSTSASSETDAHLTSFYKGYCVASSSSLSPASRRKTIVVASAATYYFNVKDTTACTTLYAGDANAAVIIRARRIG